ncbi:MAG TPA: TIGR01458 family HAD-type hydrolase [Cellvibrionaceae bacterium]
MTSGKTKALDIKAVFLDLSGVLYDGERVIPGAPEMVAELREHQLLLRFVTNTATKTRSDIVDKLRDLGFNLSSDELYTAPDAALAYIRTHKLHPFALVHTSIKPSFEMQFQGEPDCVVLGDAREELSYANLNRAFRLVKAGCPLIAIGDNKYFLDGDVLSLDAGAFVQAICWAADASPIIMGKPGADFFTQVTNSTDLPPEQCLMVGDDILGDIEGAQNAGLQACLVRTGKYQQGDENRLQPAARVIDSITELTTLL